MGCKNSKHNDGPENFDERWNNKTGLCLALRFEAGEEKSLGFKCGIEKKGYHTKREREATSKEEPKADEVSPMTDEEIGETKRPEGLEGVKGVEADEKENEGTVSFAPIPQ